MMSRLLLILTLSAGLSACVSILPDPAPAPSVYRLGPNSQAVTKLSNAELIRVDRPSASEMFHAGDIIVSTGGQSLAAVAQAKWAEPTPVVIQNAMVDALENSRQFIGLTSSSGTRTQTRLHLTVSNFEADFDNGPESAPLAVVQYRVVYSGVDDRNLIGITTVRKTARSASINVSNIVAAIDSANDAAMAEIVSWLEAQKNNGQI